MPDQPTPCDRCGHPATHLAAESCSCLDCLAHEHGTRAGYVLGLATAATALLEQLHQEGADVVALAAAVAARTTTTDPPDVPPAALVDTPSAARAEARPWRVGTVEIP